MASKKNDKDNAPSDPIKGQMPMRVEISWIEQADKRRDAVDMAKGHIEQRFVAKDAAWYRVVPFMGGYFWEAHEGGPGKSYLDAIVDELKRNPGGEYWFPNGPTKVVRIIMQDGKPKALVPNEQESLAIRNSGRTPLIARSSMTPYARRGTGLLIFGSVFSGASFLYMLGTMGFYLTVWEPGPSVRDIKITELPAAQWSMVEFTDPRTIVSKLQYSNGRWEKIERQHTIPALELEIQKGREINAEFGRQEFEFEKLEAGKGIVAPTTTPTPANTAETQSGTPPSATATKPATVQPVVTPPAVTNQAPVIQSNPANTPSVATPTGQQPAAGAVTPSADEERSKRVMDQIKRMREMNAQKAGNPPSTGTTTQMPTQQGAKP
jgi:hypothetical protein